MVKANKKTRQNKKQKHSGRNHFLEGCKSDDWFGQCGPLPDE